MKRIIATLALTALSPLALAQQPPSGATAPSSIDNLIIPSPPPTVAPQVLPNGMQAPPPNAAPPVPTAQSKARERDRAFEEALKQATPLNPNDIRTFRRETERAQRAAILPLDQRKSVTRAIRLSLKPGEESPVIKVQPGMVSSLTFSDITGQSWPVLSVVTGNPNAYRVQSAGLEGSSNIVVVSALQQFVPGNMVVSLQGHPVPITLALDQNSPQTDFRVDVRIDARGPNAVQNPVGMSSLAPVNDSTMQRFLDGNPPSNAIRLKSSSSDVEAWKLDDALYVRTSGEVLSPAYSARSTSVSGASVYTMIDSPVVLVSSNGRMSRVRISR